MKFYNEMILQNNIGSAAIRVPRIFEASKKIVKVHQNVLVFYKPFLIFAKNLECGGKNNY